MDLPDIEAALVSEDEIEEVVVEAERPRGGAVDRELDRVMVEAFPDRSPDELLRALPGLHQSAHGGQGKAYQVFLRGFDAEHGTAIGVDLEGIPLNEVDNVHGHGYLDLHLIPSLIVQGVSLHAGPPRAQDGNFSIVGDATYRLGLERAGLYVEAGGGTDRSGQGAATYRPQGASDGTFIVAEGTTGLGAGPQRSWRQARAGLGYEAEGSSGSARVFALAYDGRFDSPGALREDDLDTMGLYGAYDGAGGGASRRLLGGAVAEANGTSTTGRALLWGGVRQLELRQNFTGYLFDAQDGDGTLQRLDTLQGGGAIQGSVALPLTGTWIARAGADVRHDSAQSRIDAADPDYEPLEALAIADTHQANPGGWAELLAHPIDALSLQGGARVDGFSAEVADPEPRRALALVALPSGRLVLTPAPVLELSVAGARGVQSPESRAVLDGARAPVTLADVYELGLGLRALPGLTVRGAGFLTRLDDELVFDHTVARYVSGGTTRRVGVTGVLEWAPADAVVVLTDLTYTDGRFAATNTPIPFAPRWLGSAGLFLRQLSAGPALITGGLRVWGMGRRPLPGGFVSQPALAGDLVASAELGAWTLTAEVDNALGNAWRDGEFVYPSAWDLDGPRSERPELHVTAGEPFALRLGIGLRFW